MLKKSWLIWVVVALVLFIVHITYIPNLFTWLDHTDIEKGRALKTGWQIITTRFSDTSFYRPMVTFAHLVDFKLYGLWAPGYHITNILLHISAAFAATVALSVFLPLSIAEQVIVALFIGIHPIGWLPAGQISYRPELLLSLFCSLTIICYRRARQNNSVFHSIIAAILFLCALWSKETALIMLPLSLAVWETCINLLQWKKQTYIPIATCVTSLAVYLLIRLRAVPEVWSQSSHHLSLSNAIGTRLVSLGHLLIELISPFIPRLSDATMIYKITSMQAIICGLFLFGLIAIVIKWRNSHVSVLLILLGISLLPTLNLLALPRFTSPHYAYLALLPMAGLIILARRQKTMYKLITAVLVLWIAIAGYSTVNAGTSFYNDETLFKPQVERDSRFAEGYFYLGYFYQQQNQPDLASTSYQKALQKNNNYIVYVDRSAALINLAGVKYSQKQFSQSQLILQQAYRESPEYRRPAILYNRAVIYYAQKDYQSIVKLLDKNTYTSKDIRLQSILKAAKVKIKEIPE